MENYNLKFIDILVEELNNILCQRNPKETNRFVFEYENNLDTLEGKMQIKFGDNTIISTKYIFKEYSIEVLNKLAKSLIEQIITCMLFMKSNDKYKSIQDIITNGK